MLPSAAFARVTYLCSMDGKVRSSCCCPTSVKQREAAPLTSMKGACCCEISTIAPSKTAAIDPPKANAELQPPTVAVVTLARAALPLHRVATFAPRAHAPPDHPGRSLFVSLCTFLL